MSPLVFSLPDGSTREVEVAQLFNAGYAGREQAEVAEHVAELGRMGVPAPNVTPALYPIAPYLAMQGNSVPAQHGHTSGEAEWALVIGDDPADPLLTVACDHTDRDLELHGVAWSKNAAPDVLGDRAWRLADVADRIDTLRLRAWVCHVDTADPSQTTDEQAAYGAEELIQDAALSALLSPAYWLDDLSRRGWLSSGTVLLSGTVTMTPGVDPYADHWRVELYDPAIEDALSLAYAVKRMPEPIT